MKENILKDKAYNFVLQIVKLYQYLANSLLEDCEEIQKPITSSIKTAKINLQK
ncbi:MAG: hypothetical protein H0W58_00765 [Acidobacteria bacterium]|jgi:hypothetical protein|nr:hypothetical protein [Acidobacteriota bacterium]